jgi:hypothetical protein
MWQCIKIHSLSLVEYVGKSTGGLEKLRAGITAENAGIEVPLLGPWLSKTADFRNSGRTAKSRHHR